MYCGVLTNPIFVEYMSQLCHYTLTLKNKKQGETSFKTNLSLKSFVLLIFKELTYFQLIIIITSKHESIMHILKKKSFDNFGPFQFWLLRCFPVDV